MKINGTIEYETDLYAYVLFVQDSEVCLGLPRQKSIYCSVNDGLAKKLSQKLKQWVCLLGKVKCNLNCDVESFRIDKILDYEDGPFSVSLETLSKEISPYWDKIEDVDKFIQGLRNEED